MVNAKKDIELIKQSLTDLRKLKPQIKSFTGKGLIKIIEENFEFYSQEISKVEDGNKLDLVGSHDYGKNDRLDRGEDTWEIAFPPYVDFRCTEPRKNVILIGGERIEIGTANKYCYINLDHRKKELTISPHLGATVESPSYVDCNLWSKKEILDSLKGGVERFSSFEKYKYTPEEVFELIKNAKERKTYNLS